MPLKVLNLNLRYDSGTNEPIDWCHRSHRVTALIRESNAQLLAFQEVLPGQRELLEREFPDYQWVGRGRQMGGFGEQCLLAISWDFPVATWGTFWLSENPDSEASVGWDACLPRICTWVELALGERQLTFANTHFDHVGEQARKRSAQLLLDRFLGKSLILAGDFNATPSEDCIGILKEQLQEVLQVEDITTYQDFGALPEGPRLDYIWATPELSILSAKVVEEELPYCSDHFALAATFEGLIS